MGTVKDKTAEEIVKVFSEKWLSVMGTPKMVLTDNGREFQNDEMLVLCERFGIKVCSTAAESPWSNGMA